MGAGNVAGHRRRKAILEFIQEYRDEHGFAPTQREIRETVGPSSPNDLVAHLRRMEDEDGVIRVAPKVARGIVVTGTYEDE